MASMCILGVTRLSKGKAARQQQAKDETRSQALSQLAVAQHFQHVVLSLDQVRP